MTILLAAEGPSPILPHTAEIIVGTIAFLLLLWVLWRTVFPQFEKIYAERTDKIEGGLKRAEEAQQDADDLKRQYEEQLAGLRAEAARIVFAAFINGVARQPEARGQLQGIAFIGMALSEALAILGLVLAFAL
jgi:F-type H+-transporting ATPase subunit b